MKPRNPSLLALTSACFTLVQPLHAAVVTAAATGATIPVTASSPATVSNGDFLIAANLNEPNGAVVGNGVNEFTTWTFDFTSDPNFGTFPSGGTVTSALLKLSLTPRDALITTDTITISGLPEIVTPIIQGLSVLPLGSTHSIELQLLDSYTSADILTSFNSAVAGQILMEFREDAILSYAELALTAVPEPHEYAGLVGLGLLGFCLWRRRRD